jgi:hypothetical protein
VLRRLRGSLRDSAASGDDQQPDEEKTLGHL